MITIRLASPLDSKSILEIYSPYIENTSYTFETETPSVDEFAGRIRTYLENWPWLVCEADGIVAGYAYAGKYRERTAYQWCAETSVYIHEQYRQFGIGRALYSALAEILSRQGYRNLYAVINLPNEKSVSFHESMGYREFATFEKVGYKLGQWKNVGWWRLTVNEFGHDPAPPIPFSKFDRNLLPKLFQSACALIKNN